MARKPAALVKRTKKGRATRVARIGGTKFRKAPLNTRRGSTQVQRDNTRIDACMREFEKNENSLRIFLDQVALVILGSPVLSKEVHTVKTRLKSKASLRDKLGRKFTQERKSRTDLDIRPQNLFEKINDVVGIRILHLHRGQLATIDRALRGCIEEHEFRLLEVFARTWDDKSRDFFRSINIPTEVSETMYTSVHYVIASGSRNIKTCEIQVRTLLEEVWGEIDHSMNYPHPIDDVACRAQLRTLAHAIMGAGANVDGIVATVAALKR